MQEKDQSDDRAKKQGYVEQTFDKHDGLPGGMRVVVQAKGQDKNSTKSIRNILQ